jgi:hypothetical protein
VRAPREVDVIRTLATPEQISHYFCGRAVKKRSKPEPAMVAPCIHTQPDGWCVQLAIVTKAPQLSVHPNARIAGGIRHAERSRANKQIEQVLSTLQNALRRCDRSRIEHITFTRISPGRLDDDDNLASSFKHIADATCAWVERGDEFNEKDRRGIGHFDKRARKAGLTWDYQQETNAEDRRRHGIRIRFRLRPSSPSSTTSP